MKSLGSLLTIILIIALTTFTVNANRAPALMPIVEEASLAIYPIVADDLAVTEMLTLDEGLSAGLVSITERGQGTVNTVYVTNKSAKPLLILGGELIRGGKQDRVYEADVIVAPKSSQEVAVYCVEPGRWSGDYNFGKVSASGEGKSKEGAIAPPLVRERAAINQDQNGVWSAVAYQRGDVDHWHSAGSIADSTSGIVAGTGVTVHAPGVVGSVLHWNGSAWESVKLSDETTSGAGITSSGLTTSTITLAAGTVTSLSTTAVAAIPLPNAVGTLRGHQSSAYIDQPLTLTSSGGLAATSSGSTTLLQVYADPKLQAEFDEFQSRVNWCNIANPVGMVITLNGRIILAERFASAALFTKYRGKLLRAAFLESKRRTDEKVAKVSITAGDIVAALRRADARVLVEREGTLYSRVITRGTPYATMEIASGARPRAQAVHFVSFNTSD